jgi:hypothetical protein
MGNGLEKIPDRQLESMTYKGATDGRNVVQAQCKNDKIRHPGMPLGKANQT